MGTGPYDLSKAMVDAIESSVTSSADVMVCNATTGKALVKRGLAVAIEHGAFALTPEGIAEREWRAARDAEQARRNAEADVKLAADMDVCECGNLGCSHGATACMLPATLATLCEGCHVAIDLGLPGTCDVAPESCPTLRRIGDVLASRGWAVSNSVIMDVMRLPYPGRRTVEAVADRIMEVSSGVARVPFDWAAGLTDVQNLPTATEYVALLAGSVATVRRLPRKVKKSMGAQRGRHGRKGR